MSNIWIIYNEDGSSDLSKYSYLVRLNLDMLLHECRTNNLYMVVPGGSYHNGYRENLNNVEECFK